jgi:hypothetical protein
LWWVCVLLWDRRTKEIARQSWRAIKLFRQEADSSVAVAGAPAALGMTNRTGRGGPY